MPVSRANRKKQFIAITDLDGSLLVELVRAADEKTLVICLFSSGVSALLVAPMNDLTVSDKQDVTSSLLKAGASIKYANI